MALLSEIPSSGIVPQQDASPAARGGRVTAWAVLILAAAALLAWTGGRWLWSPAPTSPAPVEDRPPPDPRLIYKGPYRNIHPDVKYVGDTACGGCHKTETDGFHRHPMGRSIVPMAQLAATQRYDSKVHNPFEALRSRFVVERRGDKVWHRQERRDPRGKVLACTEVEAQYVIGSGSRGHSYFTARRGFLFQTPISWYGQKQIWDLSPGFHSGSLRPVVPGCLVCHAGGARPVEHAVNRYEEPIFRPAAIGCERCHGPGEVHVKARKADEKVKGRIDYTIVNPKRLPPDLRENICQQCHLEGEVRILRRGRGLFDYRPGLPLQQFSSIFVRAPGLAGERRAVSHIEQMYQSKCFRSSKGTMGCATCHDPHEAPPTGAVRVAFHRQKCLSCHETKHRCSLERAARLKRSKEDSCIDCHMQRLLSDDIVHTATTDHSIPRLPRSGDAPAPGRRPGVLPDVILVPFHKSLTGDSADADRDLGMALVKAAREKKGVFLLYKSRAVHLLEKAVAKHPRDIAALKSLAQGLEADQRLEKALDTFERLLTLAPREVSALRGAAALAQQLERFEESLGYWQKVAAEAPYDDAAHFYCAFLLARTKRYETALAACRKLLAVAPLFGEGYLIAAHCHTKLGQPAQAAAALKKAEQVMTPELERFREQLAGFLD